MGTTEEYVYDLETYNHHFSAGIGKLIVHNTDSNYITFPHIKNTQQLWDHSIDVADKISQMFPDPIKLEFEDAIYSKYLILSKKRYAYIESDRNGKESSKIGKKGILLARRDNSRIVKDLYEAIIKRIFAYENRTTILNFIIDEMNAMCAGLRSHKILGTKIKKYDSFVITKAVGDTGGLRPILGKNDKGQPKWHCGDYTIAKCLPQNQDEANDIILRAGFDSAESYYISQLPPQVQLAEKMRKRGTPIEPGTRLEYVVTNPNTHGNGLASKMEHIDYFKSHSSVLEIDYYYYLEQMVNPIDEILNVRYAKDNKNISRFNYQPHCSRKIKVNNLANRIIVTGGSNFISSQYKFRFKHRKPLLKEIQKLRQVNLVKK